MSIKRQATTELNHDNWDQEDPAEHEEMGSFKTAPKEVLEKRVIKTAKRRSQISTDEPKKSVFSGFGGFNKTQPSSFDFLANLTNGSKPTNGSSTTTTSEAMVSSSLFMSKAASPGGGLFGIPTSTPSKPTFGSTSSPFTMPSSKPEATSVFGGSKADSTVSDTTNKLQPVTSSADSITKSSAPATTASASPFNVSSTNANDNKTLFATTNTTPFKMQTVTSTSKPAQNITSITSSDSNNEKKDDANNSKKMKYYAKLKGLNESVSDWIKKHVEKTPLCILSPIFKDYEKYLKDIQEEYHGGESEDKKTDTETNKPEVKSNDSSPPKNVGFGIGTGTSLFSTNNSTAKASVFGSENKTTSTSEKPSTFSFGINNNSGSMATTSAGFSFGSTSTSNTTSPFATATNTTSTGPSTAPFSFGTGKPFSFSPSSVQQNTDSSKPDNNEDEDEPPKVEFTPIAEENSVYDKKCKIFVKKDGNFTDNGVGTLYIKKVVETGKHQLLVRANTSLGTVLLNLILSSSVPTQRMGKNNVMLVCIPTPDAKPPPTPVLIRVKTGEEADQLLETLNKYKT